MREIKKEIPRAKRGQHLPRGKNGLNLREEYFIDKFLETHNATEAAIYAGYSEKSAAAKASRMLRQDNIQTEIAKRQQSIRKASIASAQEVMEYLTRVMNGEEKDQFGLDAPLRERTKAAIELAKRTVDLDNRINGKSDNVVEVKLNWNWEE